MSYSSRGLGRVGDRSMETEEILATCFPDLNVQPAAELEPCTNKPHSPKASSPAEACFDCNICLDYSTNPVITLCGHLYCWPCIFRWLHLDAAIPGHCPVCKSPISESSLVPLYGCGLEAKPDHQDENIPERPRDHRNFTAAAAALDPNLPLSPRQHVQVHQNHYNDDRDIHRGILPFAILPGAFRNHRDSYSNLNQTSAMMAAGGSLSRRQELIENWLHQLWIFLVCCAFLCLIFF